MREVVLYGLDREKAVRTSEKFVGLNDTQLMLIARKRLIEFHSVEVWDQSVCILRIQRR